MHEPSCHADGLVINNSWKKNLQWCDICLSSYVAKGCFVLRCLLTIFQLSWHICHHLVVSIVEVLIGNIEHNILHYHVENRWRILMLSCTCYWQSNSDQSLVQNLVIMTVCSNSWIANFFWITKTFSV